MLSVLSKKGKAYDRHIPLIIMTVTDLCDLVIRICKGLSTNTEGDMIDDKHPEESLSKVTESPGRTHAS